MSKIRIKQIQGLDTLTFYIPTSGNTVSRIANAIYATTISATTYQNLPIDIRVTGGTYSDGTATFTNNTGGTFTVTGFSTGSSSFTGGTITGPTTFTNGLTANTISATTIQTPSLTANSTGLTVTGSINNTISGQTLSTSYNSPVNRLDINSNVNLGFQAGASGGIFFYVDGSATNRSLWLHPSSAVLIGNPTATSPNATLQVTNVGTPNSFLVEDDTNPDSTPFLIDNAGNVGIGTTTPIAKLDVSGNARISGGLTANTISATTYNNLPKVAFSPMNIAVCDTAPTAGSTQYYYQTIAEVTTTLSKVKLWGFSGSDLVLFGLYRGTLQSGMTLIGQARKTCGIGPNELTLTAETGQTLAIVAGEDLVIGYYPDGASWRTIYDVGISDIFYGLINTGNITTMPATPTGTATGIRFACTLY